MDSDPFIKIIVVGEQGVGKTCLLNQYCYNRFDANSPPTIGCDFTTKITSLNQKTVRLQLWDIAGQEKYNSVSKLYVRGALGFKKGCVIVSDISDENSLNETLKWKNIIEENCDQMDGKCIPSILVQNKCDLVGDGKQEFQEQDYVDSFAQKNGFLMGIQTSAKENIGLKVIEVNNIIAQDLFQRLITEIIERGLIQTQQQNFSKSNNVILQNDSNPSVKPSQQQSNNQLKKKNSDKCC